MTITDNKVWALFNRRHQQAHCFYGTIAAFKIDLLKNISQFVSLLREKKKNEKPSLETSPA